MISTHLSLADYAAELLKNGAKVMNGAPGTLWIGHESRSLIRLPTFSLERPSPTEIQRLFRAGGATVISYITTPDEQHPANSWLYLCHTQAYTPNALSKNARRDIRRAQRTLRFEALTWPTVLAHGGLAFGQTRTRVGLSDGDAASFEGHFHAFARNPAHHAVGAWHENRLIAFMSLVTVEDWVEIQGSFSTDADRDLCPNDGLCHYVLEHFLTQQGCTVVSYGLSSVQQHNNEAGLHKFKQKAGFTAQPVHRSFVIHPLLRPFVNPLTLSAVKVALRLKPGSRPLKKAAGMLSALTQPKPLESDLNE